MKLMMDFIKNELTLRLKWWAEAYKQKFELELEEVTVPSNSVRATMRWYTDWREGVRLVFFTTVVLAAEVPDRWGVHVGPKVRTLTALASALLSEHSYTRDAPVDMEEHPECWRHVLPMVGDDLTISMDFGGGVLVPARVLAESSNMGRILKTRGVPFPRFVVSPGRPANILTASNGREIFGWPAREAEAQGEVLARAAYKMMAANWGRIKIHTEK